MSASCQLRVSAGTHHSTTSLIPRGVMDFSEQASPEHVRWIIANEEPPPPPPLLLFSLPLTLLYSPRCK